MQQFAARSEGEVTGRHPALGMVAFTMAAPSPRRQMLTSPRAPPALLCPRMGNSGAPFFVRIVFGFQGWLRQIPIGEQRPQRWHR